MRSHSACKRSQAFLCEFSIETKNVFKFKFCPNIFLRTSVYHSEGSIAQTQPVTELSICAKTKFTMSFYRYFLMAKFSLKKKELANALVFAF